MATTLGNRRKVSSKPPEGALAHLTREWTETFTSSNWIVNVTPSSIYNQSVFGTSRDPKHVADLERNSVYFSNDEKGTWICCVFKERRVIPTSYSVRSYEDGPGGLKRRVLVDGN